MIFPFDRLKKNVLFGSIRGVPAQNRVCNRLSFFDSITGGTDHCSDSPHHALPLLSLRRSGNPGLPIPKRNLQSHPHFEPVCTGNGGSTSHHSAICTVA